MDVEVLSFIEAMGRARTNAVEDVLSEFILVFSFRSCGNSFSELCHVSTAVMGAIEIEERAEDTSIFTQPRREDCFGKNESRQCLVVKAHNVIDSTLAHTGSCHTVKQRVTASKENFQPCFQKR